MLRWHGFSKVHPCTIYEWRATIPEFSEALRTGKYLADERMKRSLYQRGIGYDLTAVKTEERLSDDGKFKVAKRTTSTVHVPGDVGAQKLWLVNRCPSEWREKVEVSHEVVPEMTAAQARDELIAFLIEHGVRIAPPLGQTIEGETIAAPDGQSKDTGGVALTKGRRPYPRYARREPPPDLDR
jgi:hypothetical protein